MRIHPLRRTLTPKDYDRIQAALDREDVSAVSMEELDAVADVMFDWHANRVRTHVVIARRLH
tara:strand:+ start:256 stop:441 length:186 start_codon:yes stop_codon:yes gene_type:complete